MHSTITVMNEKEIFPAIQASRKKLIFPHIAIDGCTRAVEAGGIPVQLTTSEFEILYLLACSPEEPLSASDIYRRVWHMDHFGNIAPVRVHMSNLRRKLRAVCPWHEFIISKWKKGYLFLSD